MVLVELDLQSNTPKAFVICIQDRDCLAYQSRSLLTDRSRVCYFTLISCLPMHVAHRALGFTQVDAEWRMHLKRIHDATYAAREDCTITLLGSLRTAKLLA